MIINFMKKKIPAFFLVLCMLLSTLAVGPFGTISAMADTTLAAPDADTISVNNYISGIKDKVIVTGLASGDKANVYDALSDGNLIGSAQESGGTAIICPEQLGIGAGTVYVSVTRDGVESPRTAKPYISEPIPWQIYDHTGNWGEDANIPKQGITAAKYPAYPVDGSGNSDDNLLGIKFNKHIIVKNNGSRITFYGYGQPSYKDFIFLPSDSTSDKTFTFDLDTSTINYHSMEGAGFLFNTKIENNLLSGYAILFTGTEYSSSRQIKLYKLENIDVNKFHESLNGSAYSASSMSNYGTLINSVNTPAGNIHSITFTVSHDSSTDKDSITMIDKSTDTTNNTSATTTVINGYTLPNSYGYGLGLIASYLSHSCSILSYFTVNNLHIDGINYSWPVLDLSAQPGDSSASLTYTAPAGADVVVMQKSTDGINYTTAETSAPLTPASTGATVTGLVNDQPYYLRLLVGGGDNAGISNVITVTPKKMIGDLTAVGKQNQVDLTFTAPEGASAVKLQYSKDGQTYTDAATSAPITAASTNASVTGLTNGQKYFFKLVITGGTYDGTSSNIAIATPIAASVPDAPTGVTATAGNSNASLAWTAPTDDGGSAITDYKIDVYSNGSMLKTIDTKSTGTSATVPDLTNGTAYKFDVKAVNSVGDSLASAFTNEIIPTVPASVPDAPTGVTATAGNSNASLTWSAPADDGGSAITDYKIDVYSNGSLLKTIDTKSTNTSAAVSDLTNGTAYKFDVKAVNSVGDSLPSAFTSEVTPSAPAIHVSPSNPAPTGPTITANVVDGKKDNAPVATVKATVTADANGTDTINVKPSDAIVMKQPNGASNPFEDYSKVGYEAPAAAPVTVKPDGTVQISNLAKGESYDIPVTYDLGGGQKITIGNMHISIDSTGNVSMTSNLIDPYGTLTDSLSGKAISGANVTLYYADTARNRSAGKIPGTKVELPAISGFKPNDNKNPQTTDSDGAYGYMVYPNTDYYISVEKDGYDTFTSPSISVGTELVKFSARLNPPIKGERRIAGDTRVDTSIELAKSEFTGKVNSIIFATADNYPDALAGSVLAYQEDAPIILVGDSQKDMDKVLTYMKDYLTADGKVFLLGGTGVVTENFANHVKAAGYSNIIRLGGADRYETSSKIADYLNVSEGTPVVIASGENYPDALSVSSAAAVNQYPILLVTKNTISNSVKDELAKIKPNKIYIIGENGVISSAVESNLASLSSNISRLGGADRYATSVSVASNFKLSGKSACITTGTNFPDALAGSVYAAKYNAPIILVKNTLTDEQKTYIQNSKLSGYTIFGGKGAVNDEVQNEVTGLLSK